jgi:hypothetical protein
MLVVDEGVPGPLLRAIERSGNDGQPSRFPGMVMDGNRQLVRSIYDHLLKPVAAVKPAVALDSPPALLPAWALEALCRCRTASDAAARAGSPFTEVPQGASTTNVNAASLQLVARALGCAGPSSLTAAGVIAALARKYPNLNGRKLHLVDIVRRRDAESLLLRSPRFRGVSITALNTIIAYV